jgi:hypothetical protein
LSPFLRRKEKGREKGKEGKEGRKEISKGGGK